MLLGGKLERPIRLDTSLKAAANANKNVCAPDYIQNSIQLDESPVSQLDHVPESFLNCDTFLIPSIFISPKRVAEEKKKKKNKPQLHRSIDRKGFVLLGSHLLRINTYIQLIFVPEPMIRDNVKSDETTTKKGAGKEE